MCPDRFGSHPCVRPCPDRTDHEDVAAAPRPDAMRYARGHALVYIMGRHIDAICTFFFFFFLILEGLLESHRLDTMSAEHAESEACRSASLTRCGCVERASSYCSWRPLQLANADAHRRRLARKSTNLATMHCLRHSVDDVSWPRRDRCRAAI